MKEFTQNVQLQKKNPAAAVMCSLVSTPDAVLLVGVDASLIHDGRKSHLGNAVFALNVSPQHPLHSMPLLHCKDIARLWRILPPSFPPLQSSSLTSVSLHR